MHSLDATLQKQWKFCSGYFDITENTCHQTRTYCLTHMNGYCGHATIRMPEPMAVSSYSHHLEPSALQRRNDLFVCKSRKTYHVVTVIFCTSMKSRGSTLSSTSSKQSSIASFILTISSLIECPLF